MQAQSALGRHGRIMGGTLMIGVVPSDGEPNASITHNNSHMTDSRYNSGRLDNSHIANISSNLGNTTSRSIRPLTQAYKAAQSEHEVTFVFIIGYHSIFTKENHCENYLFLLHFQNLFLGIYVFQHTK